MRLCACLDIGLDIIEPCGFLWDEKKIRRAGMDYIEMLEYARHSSWEIFESLAKENGKRLVLLTTKTDHAYTGFSFDRNDILIAGRESAGVPECVHNRAEAKITIPMKNGARSINVVNSLAMITGEAIRQIQF